MQMQDQQPPYTIKWNGVLGRHLVAARDIRAGEVIIDEEAIVQGPSPSAILDSSEAVCLVCFSVYNTSLACQCSKCFLSFCSHSCLEDGSHEHDIECRIFSTIPSLLGILHKENDLYQFINVIRSLATKRHHPLKWTQINELQSSNVSKTKSMSVTSAWSSQTLYHAMSLLSWDLFESPNSKPVESARNAMSIHENTASILTNAAHCLGVLRTNAFSELRKQKSVENLYFLGSFMAHSCCMNTDIQFDPDPQGSRVVVMAAKEILAGEAITNTYVPVLSSASERYRLLSSRGFVCTCQRCSDPTEFGSFFSSILCPSCSNFSLAPWNGLQWKCLTCNQVLDDEASSSISIQLRNVEAKLATIDKTQSISRLAELKKEKWLHPNHALIIQEMFQICQIQELHSEGELKTKFTCAEQVLAVLEKLFPGSYYMFVGRVRFHRWLAARDLEDLRLVVTGMEEQSFNTVIYAKEAYDILHKGLKGSVESEMCDILLLEYPEIQETWKV